MQHTYTCPHCGKDITAIIDQAFRNQRSQAGKAKTAKKTAAQRSNMARLNAAYSPEKRKAAAEKRRATMEAKKESRRLLTCS